MRASIQRANLGARAGVVLPTVLVVLLSVCLAAGMLSAHAARSMAQTRRTLDAQRAFVAAECVLAGGVMAARNLLVDGGLDAFADRYGSISALPSPDPDYEVALRILPHARKTVAGGATSGQQDIDLVAGARNPATGVAVALRETIRASWNSLGDYAAFYEGDLEAHPGATMAFVGKVHSNGSIYASGNVEFDRNLTCVGSFQHLRKESGARNGTTGLKIRFGDDDALADPAVKDGNRAVDVYDSERRLYVDSTLGASWLAQSALHYGGAIQTGENGITPLKPPISVEDDNHAIIEAPLPASDPARKANTESQKFAAKAALTIHVFSDGSWSVRDHGGADLTSALKEATLKTGWTEDGRTYYDKDYATGAYRFATGTDADGRAVSLAGGIQTGNAFLDLREKKAMQPCDLYLDQILAAPALRAALEAADGTEGTEKILYVEVDESVGHPVVEEKTERVKTGEKWVDATDTPAEYYEIVGTRRYGSTTYYCYYDESGKMRYSTTPHVVKTPSQHIFEHWEDVYEDVTTTETNFVPTAPCVRLRNAADLQGLDLSVVSARPVYVEGSFNTDGGAGWAGQSVGQSALVAGDAVTMLSRSFHDAWLVPDWGAYREKGAAGLVNDALLKKCTDRAPSETTFNGVVMTGIVPTLGSAYSGGLENVFRFLEGWRGSTYNFNGSIICMWDSREASAPWPNVDYVYGPPARKWGYSRMTPPGLPNLFSVKEISWTRDNWSAFDE